MKISKQYRHGMSYADKPWCVFIKIGNEKTIHRFKTEQEADEFVEGYGSHSDEV